VIHFNPHKSSTNHPKKRNKPAGIGQLTGSIPSALPLLDEDHERNVDLKKDYLLSSTTREHEQAPQLSQLLEYDWDESLIPVSLPTINHPKVVFKIKIMSANGAADPNPAGCPHLSAKKYASEKE
jgi:hypothetical protein